MSPAASEGNDENSDGCFGKGLSLEEGAGEAMSVTQFCLTDAVESMHAREVRVLHGLLGGDACFWVVAEQSVHQVHAGLGHEPEL